MNLYLTVIDGQREGEGGEGREKGEKERERKGGKKRGSECPLVRQ